MAEPLFCFKQRVGKLNWHALSSIDFDSIVTESSITSLQSVIDTVTFSKFDVEDVKIINVENLAKLVNLMQLIIEYILYCQETQCEVNLTLYHKFKSLQGQMNDKTKKYVQLKELVKTNHTQINCLKSMLAISSVADGQLNFSESRENNKSPDNSNTIQLISSILASEKETRKDLMTMLEDQKKYFTQEVANIVSTSLQRDNSIENLSHSSKQIELHETIKNVFQRLEKLFDERFLNVASTSQPQLRKSLKNVGNTDDDEGNEKIERKKIRRENIENAALISQLRIELDNKDLQLQKLALEHQHLVRELQTKIQDLSQLNIEQANILNQTTANSRRSLKMAATLICASINRVFARMQRKALSRWAAFTSLSRQSDLEKDFTRRLRVAAIIHERKQEEMHVQLKMDKDKAQVDQAKYNVLWRQHQEMLNERGNLRPVTITTSSSAQTDYDLPVGQARSWSDQDAALHAQRSVEAGTSLRATASDAWQKGNEGEARPYVDSDESCSDANTSSTLPRELSTWSDSLRPDSLQQPTISTHEETEGDNDQEPFVLDEQLDRQLRLSQQKEAAEAARVAAIALAQQLTDEAEQRIVDSISPPNHGELKRSLAAELSKRITRQETRDVLTLVSRNNLL